MTKPFVIAVDGLAASGKGTLAKKLAFRYHLLHLDTGLAYRAVACYMLENDVNLADETTAISIARKLDYVKFDAEKLSSHVIGEAASKVAVLPGLRNIFVTTQRNIAQKPPGAVVDGRDIGTVVCPFADIKFYVIADIEERARRRCRQIATGENSGVYYSRILDDLKQRDARDMNRRYSPLKQAEDAFLLNTTELGIEEAFEAACQLIDNRKTNPSAFFSAS